MAELIYAAIASLDGYVADAEGKFEWSAPDEQVHAAVNDIVRPVGTQLLGRRMYEVLSVWDSPDMLADSSPVIRDFAELWQACDKIVYSRTLESVGPRARVEREFEPDAVRELKRSADRDLSVGGPELAAQALATGLVDQCHLFLNPIVVGGGTRALPEGIWLELELVGERRFGGGVVHLHYRTRT